MKVMLTGATGFVGGHVLKVLLEEGARIRCLVRRGREHLIPDSDLVEITTGDLRDPDSVDACASGCDAIFHVAADYRLWVPDPSAMFAVNVQGTRHVLNAARKNDVKRVVYTSTVGTLGIPMDGSAGNEETPVSFKDMVGPYKQSKYLAEQEALRAAQDGLDVVVVNPSTPVGPGDVKPTPTGKMILEFLQRRMPAYLNTGLNLIHVRDVAHGHLLALKRGRRAERYILGNQNLTLREIFEMLSRITGIPAPRIRLPRLPVLLLAYVSHWWSLWITKKEPRIPLDGVRMAAHHMFFDSSKAVRELNLPQTPVWEALREACEWFHQNGYVNGRKLRDAV